MARLLFVIALHILLLFVSQFIPWPENLLWPYLNLNGFVYYKNIFVLYPPLYFELLSNFYRIFGVNITSLQVFSYLVVIATDVLLWKAAGKKILPVLLFVPMQIFFEGNGVWVDQLLAPMFLGAYVACQKKSWLALGVLLGAALLVKQTAVYFVGVLVILNFKPRVFLGLSLILGLGLIYLILNNSVWDFYKSAVVYILTFHSTYDLQRQGPNLSQIVITAILFIPSLMIGLVKRKYLLVCLLVTSSLGIFTRFEYFHLQPALPFLALLLALSPVGLISWCLFLMFFIKFFVGSFLQSPRFILSDVPKFVTGTTLFVNTWDHNYLATNTLPAGDFFVPSTPWTMDFPGNQEKMIDGLKRDKPRFVFMQDCFYVKEVCFSPKKIAGFVLHKYQRMGKLADGTGVYQRRF